ncbi:hypothetical protein PAXRUDRAFT_603821 [Paxillus rubicundulus Ve08.2h10]|uniref:Uncharacterized protein n=1 Tax=Paxillus rubicundulus Ve08.2h10 TaxID=930991 RepID=A0A0D0CCV8_9AGAM|nr:hypothetical protein PAXRUDRAFT_603821 [Paxillus rubicundulus Ve08.2h10]
MTCLQVLNSGLSKSPTQCPVAGAASQPQDLCTSDHLQGGRVTLLLHCTLQVSHRLNKPLATLKRGLAGHVPIPYLKALSFFSAPNASTTRKIPGATPGVLSPGQQQRYSNVILYRLSDACQELA